MASSPAKKCSPCPAACQGPCSSQIRRPCAAKGVTLCGGILLIEWSACAHGCPLASPQMCSSVAELTGDPDSATLRVRRMRRLQAGQRIRENPPVVHLADQLVTGPEVQLGLAARRAPPRSWPPRSPRARRPRRGRAGNRRPAGACWTCGPHLVQLPGAEVQRRGPAAEHHPAPTAGCSASTSRGVRYSALLRGQPSDQQLLVVAPSPLDDLWCRDSSGKKQVSVIGSSAQGDVHRGVELGPEAAVGPVEPADVLGDDGDRAGAALGQRAQLARPPRRPRSAPSRGPRRSG